MVRILTVCLLIAPSVVFGMRSLDEADSEKTPKELVGEAFQLLSTDASAAARRAIELLESDIEFQPKRIATLSWIAGSGLTISGEPREAMGYLDRAEATFQEYQEKSMVLWVMRYKAAAHSELYEFEKGKAAAQRGLKLARETGASTFFRARLFNELGNNHLGAGEFSEAAKAYTQGLKLAGPRNGQLRDVLLTNMSRLLTKLSMGEDAVDTLQAVLKQAQEYGRPQICVVAHLNLGLAWSLSKPETAEQEFRLAISESNGRFPLEEARAGLELGELLRKRGQYQAAKTVLTCALQQWEQIGNESQEARAREILERLEAPTTIQDLRLQLEVATRAENLSRQQQVLEEIMALAKEAGDMQAELEAARALNQVQAILWQNSVDDMASARAEMNHLSTVRKLYDARIQQHAQQQKLNAQNSKLIQLAAGIGIAGLLAFFCYRIAQSRAKALTELKTAQAQIRQQEQVQAAIERSLLEKQKEDSVAAMARGVAHDFNNLLTGISALAELGEFADDESQKNQNFHEISGVVDQAAALTAQLSQYVGYRTGTSQSCCVTDVVATGSGMLKALTRGEQELLVDTSDENLLVLLSSSELSQVLVNLVMNSVEASAPGNRIRITTSRLELSEADFKQMHTGSGTTEGAFCCLKVADNGHGISDEMKQRIFDPYVSSRTMGRGLGLSTVLGIVRKAQGAIQVESDSGGTAIMVCLPEASEEEAAAVGSPLDHETSRRICTALYVDDDDLVRTTSVAAFENQGLRILSAANSEEAEHILLKEGARIECLVTDYSMPPGESGAWLAKRAQELIPGIPVILCTGFVDDIAVDDDRFAQVMSKPYEAVQLADEIRREVTRVLHEAEDTDEDETLEDTESLEVA